MGIPVGVPQLNRLKRGAGAAHRRSEKLLEQYVGLFWLNLTLLLLLQFLPLQQSAAEVSWRYETFSLNCLLPSPHLAGVLPWDHNGSHMLQPALTVGGHRVMMVDISWATPLEQHYDLIWLPLFWPLQLYKEFPRNFLLHQFCISMQLYEEFPNHFLLHQSAYPYRVGGPPWILLESSGAFCTSLYWTPHAAASTDIAWTSSGCGGHLLGFTTELVA